MRVKGVFIINSTKEEAQRHIRQIWNRYFNKYGNNFRQNVAMLRTTCRDMISMIDNYFVTDMAAATRYREILTGYANQDNHTQESLLVVYSILVDFKTMIDQSIPIKDLPSCKKLTELSTEDAIAVAKDLIKNDIVKSGIGLILLGLKAGDMVDISHIKTFYQEQLELLQSDIAQAGRPANEIETFLLDKFNAEIGYCNMAMFKTGLGAAKEIAGLIEKSQRDIKTYEQKLFNSHILSMPILAKR
ncbi:MAG: hypothetical protein J1D86_06360 [Alistipes sp.]|nr:hypothetical protein [Alistipes sp.]